MYKPPIWTLIGIVLHSFEADDLSTADKVRIRGEIRKFEREHSLKSDDPNFQWESVVMKHLEGLGFENPKEYKEGKERVLKTIIDDIGYCGFPRDLALARQAFLNRRHGRIVGEREGD